MRLYTEHAGLFCRRISPTVDFIILQSCLWPLKSSFVSFTYVRVRIQIYAIPDHFPLLHPTQVLPIIDKHFSNPCTQEHLHLAIASMDTAPPSSPTSTRVREREREREREKGSRPPCCEKYFTHHSFSRLMGINPIRHDVAG